MAHLPYLTGKFTFTGVSTNSRNIDGRRLLISGSFAFALDDQVQSLWHAFDGSIQDLRVEPGELLFHPLNKLVPVLVSDTLCKCFFRQVLPD